MSEDIPIGGGPSDTGVMDSADVRRAMGFDQPEAAGDEPLPSIQDLRFGIFTYNAPEYVHPPYLNFTGIKGGVEITACGEGETAPVGKMVLPISMLGHLVRSILEYPPLTHFQNTKPVVLYFANERDRAEFMEGVKVHNPALPIVAV